MIPRHLHPLVAYVVGGALFVALGVGTRYVARAAGLEGMAARQIILKSAMVVVAVGLMVLAARPRRVWGFAVPRDWFGGTLVPVVAGSVLGAAASGVILGFGFPPMAGMREMGILRIVAIIWFGSTIAEEVFIRGLVQGWMQPADGSEARSTSRGTAARVLASGLLFGSLHVSLFFVDNDPRTATTIVIATTLLGLVCAWSRERSGSIVGPLLSHFGFNACGIIGGVVVLVLKGVLGH